MYVYWNWQLSWNPSSKFKVMIIFIHYMLDLTTVIITYKMWNWFCILIYIFRCSSTIGTAFLSLSISLKFSSTKCGTGFVSWFIILDACDIMQLFFSLWKKFCFSILKFLKQFHNMSRSVPRQLKSIPKQLYNNFPIHLA